MRIVVAMSGGVDSSVAAALLAEQGHDVIGVSMQLYDNSQMTESGQRAFGTCCTIDDLYDARRVAATIGIPHYIVNFESQFGEHVIANFVREYVHGRTPIPCSHCNSDLKFAELLDRAKAYDAEQLATGHYARIERDDTGRYHLYRGADNSKDQTYFLFSLTQEQLSRAAFPVGHLDKQAVRAHAERLKLHVTQKPDSQEICFVPDGDYAAFVERKAPDAARPAPWSTATAASSARTPACIDSRSASARASACRRASRCTCWRSSPRRRRSSSDRATSWAAPRSPRPSVNWITWRRAGGLAARLGADSPSPCRGAGAGPSYHTKGAPNWSSTRPKLRLRPARPSCFTTATKCWAAGGSTDSR